MLKEKILNKENAMGMHINLNDIAVGTIAGRAGYDFIWIDMEHSYLSHENLLNLIVAIHATGTDVIVRAPQDDLTTTKKILEMGPDGIIFPMIRNPEDAKRLISYTVYPPDGIRGFGPWNAIDYGFDDVNEYVKEHKNKMCRFIQIEHIDAVNCLDELLKIDYIDGFIIGPMDLSGSMGCLGDCFSDEVSSVIKDVVNRVKAAGKYIGLSTGDVSESNIKHWHDLGIQMLSAGADFDFLRIGAISTRETLQKFHLAK